MLAVALMAGLWMLWPIIFPAPPKAPVKPAASADAAVDEQATATDVVQAASGGVAHQQVAAGSASAAHLAASGNVVHQPPAKPAEKFVELDSERAHIVLSSWGASVSTYELREYKDSVKKRRADGSEPPVDLVPGKGVEDRSLTLFSQGGTFALLPDAAYEVVKSTPSEVLFRYDTGRGVVVTRHYKLDDEGYTFHLDTRVNNQSGAVQSVSLATSITGVEREGESEGGSFFKPPVDQMSWACRTDELHKELSINHEADQTLRGEVKWGGIDRQYFLAALIPGGGTASCSAKRIGEHGMRVTVEYAPLTIPAGKEATLSGTGYFGPKHLERLEALKANVEESVNFGWFGIISRPLLWLLVFLYGYVHNYGVAIILLTLLVKLVLLPVTQKSFESSEKMKKIQPLIKEMQKKYKDDKIKASQKQMEMFKEHGVSPLGGCLPMALQMPIWFALYRTLYNSVELYQQPFVTGWIDNLAFKDPTYVLPVAVVILMVVQQFFTPTPTDNPSMKYVMWGMPLMFGVIMFQLPAGLGLYIFVNSVLTVLQQAYIRRKFAPKAEAAA